jgi:hypothetical protein
VTMEMGHGDEIEGGQYCEKVIIMALKKAK